MPYDPTHPVNGEIADADVIREKFDFTQAQIDETNARIDPIPAGPPGPAGADGAPGAEGPPGPPFAGAVVDGVAMLNPGDAATVSVSFDGTNVHFSFGLPRGETGGAGPQGPPFALAVIDGVSTLNPGENATVSASFDGTNVHFTFALPRGNDGGQGPQGLQGPPGEVSAAQLAAAIADTARNPNTVGAFPGTFSDPVTKAEMDAYVAWNEARWQSAVR